MAWTTLCDWDELTDGLGRPIDVDGYRLAVFRVGDSAHVIDSACPHAGADLSAGPVKDECVVCPRHYWTFRLSDGEFTEAPGFAVTVYKCRVIQFQGRTLVQADLALP